MSQDTPDMSKEPSPTSAADADLGAIRASNRDRERVHGYLSAAMEDGAITPEEYTERAGRAAAAVTVADLDALIKDLPLGQLTGAMNPTSVPTVSPHASAAHTSPSTRVSGSVHGSPVHSAIGIFSGATIGGGAVIGDRLRAVALMGGVEIDLRAAQFTASTVTIDCTAIMGGVEITVPEDVTVESHGMGIMGGFNGRAAGAGDPGAPRIVVRGVAVMGGVEIRRRARDGGDGRKLPR